MQIDFKIGSTQAQLKRGWFFGGMEIITSNTSIWLQHPLNPHAHFSTHTVQAWEVKIEGQTVLVEKTRPLIMGGFRKQSYVIYVNGTVVATKIGY